MVLLIRLHPWGQLLQFQRDQLAPLGQWVRLHQPPRQRREHRRDRLIHWGRGIRSIHWGQMPPSMYMMHYQEKQKMPIVLLLHIVQEKQT